MQNEHDGRCRMGHTRAPESVSDPPKPPGAAHSIARSAGSANSRRIICQTRAPDDELGPP
eukprot:5816023-Alexandrium_andersonii.AAC.1